MLFDGPELARTAANYTPLSPVSILKRVERVHPNLPAQVHGSICRNWGEVAARCKRLASALARRGVSKGDTVALIAPNIPEALECALAVPMLGAVLNANNVRLEARTLGYILKHGEASVLLVDTEFSAVAADRALHQSVCCCAEELAPVFRSCSLQASAAHCCLDFGVCGCLVSAGRNRCCCGGCGPLEAVDSCCCGGRALEKLGAWRARLNTNLSNAVAEVREELADFRVDQLCPGFRRIRDCLRSGLSAAGPTAQGGQEHQSLLRRSGRGRRGRRSAQAGHKHGARTPSPLSRESTGAVPDDDQDTSGSASSSEEPASAESASPDHDLGLGSSEGAGSDRSCTEAGAPPALAIELRQLRGEDDEDAGAPSSPRANRHSREGKKKKRF